MVSLIVVEYNSMKRTLEYIDSFLENVSCSENVNIIIIDNTPGMENFQVVEKQYFEKIHIGDIEEKIDKPIESVQGYLVRGHKLVAIKAMENLGYAKGNNLGAQISRVLFKDSYYIFSNNDLNFTEKIVLDDLLEPFKDESIAIVGPKIVGLDGKNQSPRRNNSIWKQMILYYYNILLFNALYKFVNNIDYDNRSKKVDWLMGCFLVVDSSKFNEVGLFDENTFLFAEEMVLADKLGRKNYKSYFINTITLIHNHGQTVKSTMDTLKAMEVSHKSEEYYFKNYRSVSRFSLFIAKYTFDLFKIMFPVRQNIKAIIIKFMKS